MSAHATHHGGSARTYTLILGALITLTAITVTASGIDFGSPTVNVIIALIIASIKGSLVALFFMHLKYDKPLNGVIFLTGLVFLSVFLIFCYVDADSRPTVIPQTLKVPAPAPAQPAN
jgi:cytochrome c oxidase subunit IV